jgi:hypothetical protein
MRNILLLLFFSSVVSGLSAQSSCNAALVITEGIYMVDTIMGSEIPAPICASGGGGATSGEWFLYTPAEDLLLIISTDLPATGGVDTRVHVYNGTCGNLVCVGGDDDAGTGYTSFLSMEVTAGVDYYIAFDDRWTPNGFAFQLIENEIGFIPFGFTSSPISTIGSALGAVDMNGDFLDDIVSTSQTAIRIAYQQTDGSFQTVDIQNPPVQFTASWSMAAGDLDGNGYNDLQYGNGSGVTYMYANEDGTAYSEVSFPQYVFSQRGNFIDINNDGHLDAFMCHDVAPNVFYLNDGGGNLTFNQGGLGNTSNGGNYGSIWIDYDNDCDMDLFIAKCRGAGNPASINQMHRNNGDGTYTEVGAEIGLADGVQTWSSAWGDFDNDGDKDVFVGASSFTAGGHKLMMNMGDGTFIDASEGSGFADLTSTSIEWITHDFDNDGYLDIFGGGNVIMFNNGDFTFSPTAVGISNGAIGDMNNDGFLDVVRTNAIYFNNTNNNNYIKVNVIGTASNKNGIGARVEVTSALGAQIRDVRSGDGFKHMSSLNAHFGIGTDTEIEKITVCWPSGLVSEILNPDINSTVTIVEGATTVGISEPVNSELLVYPNPATSVLYLASTQDINRQHVSIFDITGKLVIDTPVLGDQIDISKLHSGVYFLRIAVESKVMNQKFIKN